MPQEITLTLTSLSLPARAQQFVAAGLARAKSTTWFDFVPSDYDVVYTLLSALARARFCEWGSGVGIVTGLAEMLGYTALGIEIHEPLVKASRDLFAEFGLQARTEVGDYFERTDLADLYFTYCWPGMVERTQGRFIEIAPEGARLIVYYGPSDVRWIAK
jgi:protein-L-isoaspartate O-methyltransferase